jgi:hypothetical protein
MRTTRDDIALRDALLVLEDRQRDLYAIAVEHRSVEGESTFVALLWHAVPAADDAPAPQS